MGKVVHPNPAGGRKNALLLAWQQAKAKNNNFEITKLLVI